VDGKDAPSDVYVYQMKIRFLNGEEEDRTGQVTLIQVIAVLIKGK
jgi:hypothetical protein